MQDILLALVMGLSHGARGCSCSVFCPVQCHTIASSAQASLLSGFLCWPCYGTKDRRVSGKLLVS